MMRLRRASVIASLFLLASAASVYAESAWVLWTQFTEAETGEPDRTTLIRHQPSSRRGSVTPLGERTSAPRMSLFGNNTGFRK
jgi:hypothetical protein